MRTWSDRSRARRHGRPGSVLLAVWTIAALSAAVVHAQTFNSGSTEVDGALDYTGTPAGTTIVFDPVALGIDSPRDNIFHFTTITIPAGVTVRLSQAKLGGPVFWLASGPVVIAGTLDLSGQPGHSSTSSPGTRALGDPGPGGYPGGLGTNSFPPGQPGLGPGGGLPDRDTCGHHGRGGGGSFTGNEFIVPLFGGSGGAGGFAGGLNWGGGGGAGGGAILIASSVSITIGGTISANGGMGGFGNSNCVSWFGGSGSGGAVRLAAPLIRGSGSVSAKGGPLPAGSCGGCNRELSNGGDGRVRLEAFRHEFFNVSGQLSTGSPVALFLPPTPPSSVRVVSIGVGADRVLVPENPTGSFDVPDAVINAGGPVAVEIEARYVPVDPAGTATLTLHLSSLEGPDRVVAVEAPLAGSFESSTTTATVTFPPGYSRGFVRAVWR